MIKEIMDKQIFELRKLWANKRQLLFQLLNLAMIVFSALMIWKGLMFVTKSESPVVVVLSGSMVRILPVFSRFDARLVLGCLVPRATLHATTCTLVRDSKLAVFVVAPLTPCLFRWIRSNVGFW